MKKALLTFGVFCTFLCYTLAYAANSEGSKKSVAIATPSTISSDEEVPNYGVSIGTIEAKVYSESGLDLG